jgi:hypothetical protein
MLISLIYFSPGLCKKTGKDCTLLRLRILISKFPPFRTSMEDAIAGLRYYSIWISELVTSI